MTEDENRFIIRRVKLVRAWPWAGSALIVLICGLGAWLYTTRPLLVDPFAVLARVHDDSIPASTLTFMAALLPVAVLTCLFLAIVIVLFAFAAFAIEKKYLALLRHPASDAAAMRE